MSDSPGELLNPQSGNPGEDALEQRRRLLAEQEVRLGQWWEPVRPPLDWASGTDLALFRDFLLDRTGSKRKQRLFACACCRALLQPGDDPRSWQAVAVAERFADWRATLADLRAARIQAFFAARERHQARPARAAYFAVADEADQAGQRASELAAQADRTHVQCDWIRDLLPDPSQPRLTRAPAWLAWNDGTVTRVAQGIYESGAFDGLPALADALEDAGCTDDAILSHLRGPGPHVRGCWVLDLLLARE